MNVHVTIRPYTAPRKVAIYKALSERLGHVPHITIEVEMQPQNNPYVGRCTVRSGVGGDQVSLDYGDDDNSDVYGDAPLLINGKGVEGVMADVLSIVNASRDQ